MREMTDHEGRAAADATPVTRAGLLRKAWRRATDTLASAAASVRGGLGSLRANPRFEHAIRGRYVLAAAALLAAGVVVACGGASGSTATPPASPTAAGTATAVSPAVLGQQLFSDKCAICHGDNAAGGYQMGKGKATDLRWAKRGPIYNNDPTLLSRAILTGKDQHDEDLSPVMPRWQGTLTDQQVSDLVAYLLTLTTDAPSNQPLAAPAGASPGEVLYYQDCSVCHGTDGAGGKSIGTSTAADLRWAKLSSTYKNDTSLIATAILTGKDQKGEDLDSEMPLWQKTLTADQVQQIIAFLQTLK